MQSPLQLLKQCFHTGVATLVSPLSLDEERSASSRTGCPYSHVSPRTNPYLVSICFPFSHIFSRNFCRAFIFWRNGNDLKCWVAERREVSGSKRKAGLSIELDKGSMRRCFQNSGLLSVFTADRSYSALEGSKQNAVECCEENRCCHAQRGDSLVSKDAKCLQMTLKAACSFCCLPSYRRRYCSSWTTHLAGKRGFTEADKFLPVYPTPSQCMQSSYLLRRDKKPNKRNKDMDNICKTLSESLEVKVWNIPRGIQERRAVFLVDLESTMGFYSSEVMGKLQL